MNNLPSLNWLIGFKLKWSVIWAYWSHLMSCALLRNPKTWRTGPCFYFMGRLRNLNFSIGISSWDPHMSRRSKFWSQPGDQERGLCCWWYTKCSGAQGGWRTERWPLLSFVTEFSSTLPGTSLSEFSIAWHQTIENVTTQLCFPNQETFWKEETFFSSSPSFLWIV